MNPIKNFLTFAKEYKAYNDKQKISCELEVLKKYTYDKEDFCMLENCNHVLKRIKERNIPLQVVKEVLESKCYDIVEFRVIKTYYEDKQRLDYRVLLRSKKSFFVNKKWLNVCLSISLVNNNLVTAYWNFREEKHKECFNQIYNIVRVLENGKRKQII